MVIQTDDEGKIAVAQLCNFTAKYAGALLTQNGSASLQEANKILQWLSKIGSVVQALPEPEPEAESEEPAEQ